MTQDDSWNMHYQQIEDHLKRYKRNPSKHRPEERAMLHWLKYNRKRAAAGMLLPEREEQLSRLCEKMSRLKRLNQYTYPQDDVPDLFT